MLVTFCIEDSLRLTAYEKFVFTFAEVVFMGIFGISQARYYQMYENLKKRKARVHLQIINAIKGQLIREAAKNFLH